MTMQQHFRKWIFLAALWFSASPCANAEDVTVEHEILFFPLIHLEIRPHGGGEQHLAKTELEYGSDIVYSGRYDKFRLLTELYASKDEFELERLQFGYDLKPSLQFWIGRFHSPLDFWNSQYHHGVHLQSSVHRPGIVEYEDHGGPLINHTSGMKLDGNIPFNEGVINFSAALGSAPILKNNQLATGSLFSDLDKRKIHSILRLNFQPDEISATQYGIFGSYSDIVAEQEGLQKVSQIVFGAYTFQDLNPFSLIFSGIYIDNKVVETYRIKSSGFLASYAHLEYEITSNWLAYGRIERTIGNDEDLYLEYLDDPELERNLGGIRWDFTRRQAISTEVSKRVNDHDGHIHISIQWSAVFP